MKIVQIPCNRANYGSVRSGKIEYLVIHYTAAPGDTARNNGEYFAREKTGTSAHYFVDETTVVLSVPEEYTAWHCGSNYSRHPHCRNGNSIAIEICTKKDGTEYWFAPQAVQRAKELARELMKKYDIPADRVLRHYDVTGKICPAPFVNDEAAWNLFQGGLIMYHNTGEVPQWGRPTIEKLVNMGLLQGSGENLDLTYDLVRTLVILDRAGIFTKEETHGSEIE